MRIPQVEIVPAKSTPLAGGWLHVYEFKNGHSAGVISHSFSYGGESGLWELLPIGPGDEPDYFGIEGWLDDSGVAAGLMRIAALKKD